MVSSYAVRDQVADSFVVATRIDRTVGRVINGLRIALQATLKGLLILPKIMQEAGGVGQLAAPERHGEIARAPGRSDEMWNQQLPGLGPAIFKRVSEKHGVYHPAKSA